MKLTVEELGFAYGGRRILEAISFTAETGQLLSVLGANGVGKTTFFRCLLGLNRHYEGYIALDTTEIRTLSPKQMAKKIAYIPQAHYPAFNYRVFEMILMGTSHDLSLVGTPGKPQYRRVEAIVGRLGIGYLVERSFHQLSGGEQQLVLLARAIAQNARIIIMDEPTANLDYGNQIKMLTCMRELAEEGYLIIQSTHNPEQAYLFSHRILAMCDGRILADGTPQQIMTTEMMCKLYRTPLVVKSLEDDAVRVCMPAHLHQATQSESYKEIK